MSWKKYNFQLIHFNDSPPMKLEETKKAQDKEISFNLLSKYCLRFTILIPFHELCLPNHIQQKSQ